MLRQAASFALLLTFLGTWAVSTASAQSSSRRSATLGKRLEQFREDLLGDPLLDAQDITGDQGIPPVGTTAAAPRSRGAVGDKVNNLPAAGQATVAQPNSAQARSASATPSSRRTAQPNYKAGGAQPTVAQREKHEPTLAHQDKQEPTLAKPLEDDAAIPLPEPVAKSNTPTPARRADPDEAPTPRVARAVKPEPIPQDDDVKPLPKSLPRHKPTEGDVLFAGQSPMLSVEATGPRKVLIGREAVFVVKLHNSGEAQAHDVHVTINIPPFAEVVEAQPTTGSTRAPSGTERAEPFDWRIAHLDGRAHETLTLKIIPRKSIPIDLAVQWTCSPVVTQTMVEVQEPKLQMAISGPSEVHFGQSKIYKLTLSNPGNGDADNVVVNLLPIGRAGDGTASHKLGALRAGETKAVEVELTARQAGALMIRAQAFGDGGLRAEASEQVLVRRANLQIEVEGPKVKYAGTQATYRIHLTNAGDAMADGVQVSAMLPPQAKYVSSNAGGHVEGDRGKVLWNAGSLQPGAERQLEVHCVLQAPGENRLQVIGASSDNLSASANASTRVEALADLKLEVRDPQGPIPLGEEAAYEVVIRNRGTKSAENIELVVFFSEGLEAASVQGGPHEIGKGQVQFKTIPQLAAGSETVYRVQARADRPGNHIFRAELVCQSLQTKLSAEETTRFYGDEATEQPSPIQAEHDLDALQPVPQE